MKSISPHLGDGNPPQIRSGNLDLQLPAMKMHIRLGSDEVSIRKSFILSWYGENSPVERLPSGRQVCETWQRNTHNNPAYRREYKKHSQLRCGSLVSLPPLDNRTYLQGDTELKHQQKRHVRVRFQGQPLVFGSESDSSFESRNPF